METVIAGSRSIKDKEKVYNTIESAKKDGFIITEVVSGTANGVDSIGEDWAERNDIPIKKFPYEKYLDNYSPSVAPLIRNKKMAEYAEQAIIIWDGKSKGSEDMIDKAEDHDLKLYIERTDNSSIEDFV